MHEQGESGGETPASPSPLKNKEIRSKRKHRREADKSIDRGYAETVGLS